MSCAELQGGLFADCQLWYSQVAKRSNKRSTILQHGRFVVGQESRFQSSKRLNMGSAVLVVWRFDDIQEFCFQAANHSDLDCAELHGVYLLIIRYGILGREKFRYEQYHHVKGSIS